MDVQELNPTPTSTRPRPLSRKKNMYRIRDSHLQAPTHLRKILHLQQNQRASSRNNLLSSPDAHIRESNLP